MSRTHLNQTLIAGLFAAAVALAGCPAKPPPEKVIPTPASVKRFTADKPELAEPGPVTLSWEVEGATALAITTLSGDPVDGVELAPTGEVSVDVAHDTHFVLTARGEGGSDSAAVGVTVGTDREPGLLFAVTPQEVASGESATLVWSAPSDGVSITAGGETVMGSGGRKGSLLVTPPFTTEYELKAGDKSITLTLAVTPTVKGFAADVSSAMPGDEVTLSFSASGATRVSLSSDGRGELYETTDPAQMVDGSFTDTIPGHVSNLNGLVRYLLTAEGPSGAVTKELTLWVGVNPAISSFSVPEYGLEDGTFPVGWKLLGADTVEISVNDTVVFVSTTAAQAQEHSIEVSTPSASALVTLRATNARGGTVTDAKPVSPVGIPTIGGLTASPTTVVNGGDPITLSWNAPNARNVVVREKATGRALFTLTGLGAETGPATVHANRDTDFVVTVDNTLGDTATSEAAVTVQNVARVLFSPADVPAGAKVTITGTTVPQITELIGVPVDSYDAPGTAFEDIVDNGGTSIAYVGPDTSAKLVTLPETFTMPLFGQTLSGNQISFHINGWFSFRTTTLSGPDVATPLPSTVLSQWAFLPLMEDLRAVDGDIYYRFDTVEGGVRRLIVQWENVQADLNNTVVPGSSLTFQAQLYSDGRVVYAYKSLVGLTTQQPVIGLQDGSVRYYLTASQPATEGGTISFFGRTALPVEIVAYPGTQFFRGVAPTFDLDFHETMPVIPEGEFFISEVNPQPNTSAPQGEWFELTNIANRAWDLSGWELDFGGGLTHTIPQSANVVLPPNGTLLFASSADGAQNGGITPDYVYPAALTMADAAGSIRLRLAGTAYTAATWAGGSGHGPGIAAKFDPVLSNHYFLAGVTQSSCPSSGAYGTQTGTPGLRTAGCFPYRLEALPQGDFEPLFASGTKLNGTLTNEFAVTLSLGNGSLAAPIRWGNRLYNTAYVGDNGFIVLRDLPSQSAFACTSSTSCFVTNKTAVTSVEPARTIAPFWESLSGATPLAHTGIYTARRDPNGAPGTGDEYTIISWEGWRNSTTTSYDLNFQVKLFDNGNIEYHYGNMSGPNQTLTRGTSATIWLEAEDGRSALVHNINTAFGSGVDSNTALRFRYVP